MSEKPKNYILFFLLRNYGLAHFFRVNLIVCSVFTNCFRRSTTNF